MDFFAKNLKYLRSKYKMSMSSLAKRLHVNHSTVSRWESGDTGATVGNAYDVAQIFNVKVEDLICNDLEYKDKTIVIKNNIGDKTFTLPKDSGKWKAGDQVTVNEFMDYIDELKKKNDKLHMIESMLKGDE